MRAATTLVILAAGAAVLVAVGGAGADSEDPGARPAQTGPRHQLLGSWKLGGRGHVRFAADGDGGVSGRAARPFRLHGCLVRRDTVVFRGYRFSGREATLDSWHGGVLRPGRRCRRRYVASRIDLLSDLRMQEHSRRGGVLRDRPLRRIRPHARSRDPVLGTWERMDGRVILERHGDSYVGSARGDFLISNGCTVPAGTPVWKLRPSAPERYDGRTQTFQPPPGCEPGTPTASRWRLETDATRLVREAPDGTLVEYDRSG